MSKFKIGDRIRSESGEYATVKSIMGPEDMFEGQARAKFDDGSYGIFDDSQGELVEKVPEIHPPSNGAGTKFDSGKPRVSLIPKAATLGIARALSYGEKKYGTHNFRNGISFSRLADATFRHMTSWLEGENNDPESGLSHLDHAIASLAMLKFMEEHRADMDDRWLDPMNEIQKRGE